MITVYTKYTIRGFNSKQLQATPAFSSLLQTFHLNKVIMISIFQAYLNVVNALLNAEVDSQCKTWNDVVMILFEMNVDDTMSSIADFAKAFKNVPYPLYFRIHTKTIQKYFSGYVLNAENLQTLDLIKDSDFVEDAQSIRLSFGAFMQIVLSKGDSNLKEAYRFVDLIYQIYNRYKLSMMGKTRVATHWAIIERIGDFKPAMQPHIKNPNAFQGQPVVFQILKGTLKGLKSRLDKYKDDYDNQDIDEKNAPLKYPNEYFTPIYESILSDTNDEINAVVNFIQENRSYPYRLSQTHENQKKLSETSYCIKINKTMILINNQDYYTSDHLSADIELVRSKLKYGQMTHYKNDPVPIYARPKITKRPTKTIENNYTDINIFNESNGMMFDKFGFIQFSPTENDKNITPPTPPAGELADATAAHYADSSYDGETASELDYSFDEENTYINNSIKKEKNIHPEIIVIDDDDEIDL